MPRAGYRKMTGESLSRAVLDYFIERGESCTLTELASYMGCSTELLSKNIRRDPSLLWTYDIADVSQHDGRYALRPTLTALREEIRSLRATRNDMEAQRSGLERMYREALCSRG